ncbi:hypothetical protein SMICM17S_00625 [Streptomyces microflavus]
MTAVAFVRPDRIAGKASIMRSVRPVLAASSGSSARTSFHARQARHACSRPGALFLGATNSPSRTSSPWLSSTVTVWSSHWAKDGVVLCPIRSRRTGASKSPAATSCASTSGRERLSISSVADMRPARNVSTLSGPAAATSNDAASSGPVARGADMASGGAVARDSGTASAAGQ